MCLVLMCKGMKTCGACAKARYEVRHPKTGKLYAHGVSLKKAKKIEKKVKKQSEWFKDLMKKKAKNQANL